MHKHVNAILCSLNDGMLFLWMNVQAFNDKNSSMDIWCVFLHRTLVSFIKKKGGEKRGWGGGLSGSSHPTPCGLAPRTSLTENKNKKICFSFLIRAMFMFFCVG